MADGPSSVDGGQGTGDVPLDQGTLAGNELSPEAAALTTAEVAEIWTAAAMEEATPCEVIEVDEDAIAAAEDATEGAEERLIPGGEPEDLSEPQPESGDIDLLGYGYGAPFSRWENFADYRLYPYSTVGKLFFKQQVSPGVWDAYVCSASSIGGCAIVTAGHCVHTGNNSPGGWSKDVAFVPAYRDGAAPFGVWPARQLATRTHWYRHGNPKGLSEDIGGAVLHKQGGRSISQRVGWLGFAWNWSREQHWLSMGYPGKPPFNGKRQWINAASFAYNGNVGASPAPVGMGNDLTDGCSGGPWIWRFGAGNHVNGVNSYRRKGKSKEEFSPYFGNGAKDLYNVLRKLTC